MTWTTLAVDLDAYIPIGILVLTSTTPGIGIPARTRSLANREIELLAVASLPGECEGQVMYLPLRSGGSRDRSR